MHLGPHLLAPTGSDLQRYSDQGIVFAGWHTDLNFLTIHGKSNFPGLSVWTRDGKKMGVKVPDGCLLVQAGKQIEHLTGTTQDAVRKSLQINNESHCPPPTSAGGYVQAGYHEVVNTAQCHEAAAAAIAAGQSAWRISSTMFTTVSSDTVLEPVGHFKAEPTAGAYPAVKAGQQVANELAKIGLADGAAEAPSGGSRL